MTTTGDATVVVTAVGTASAEPDAVAVGLGVEASADTPAAALRLVDEGVTALLALLDAEQVPSADRRTTGLQVHPRWGPEPVPQGHTAAYALVVVVSDLDRAGRLVQRAGDAVGDALRVHAFELQVRDRQPYLAQARAAAVRSAREQAQQLVEAAGLQLGPLAGLREGDGHAPGVPAQIESLSMAADGGPSVAPGRHDVTVQVTAVYQVLPGEADRA